MPTTNIALLPGRGIVRVGGDDAASLLDGLLTNSLARLENQPALHSGLLSPQGKILFDFFLVKMVDGFLIDIDRTMADDLIKRLGFYRLRAKVTLENVSDEYLVAALWPAGVRVPGGIVVYPDPRHETLGVRLILPRGREGELPGEMVGEEAYDAHRIAIGVPEAGRDYPLPDTFPHEALYDQLGSIDFKKGCFIGQEVVSRMQHRGTARRRAMRVAADIALTSGSEIAAGEAVIGTLGSVSGETGIAMLRLDRAAEASGKGTPLRAGNAELTLEPPEWIRFDITSGKPAAVAGKPT
ncbi:MAG: folate-binding protein [Alphaproteobacteria bacterium]|nr:folate-binding protein [Alphaproteobacteria bacterium]